ncbi:hypothetical protein [Streptomyces longispororuber]|uniref:hypothetical protein n=1 Tax=Streptomyces longispororuber TaxID=68230 RepID=UPI0021090275|nr:hypothetical protein [Streptomyces longispororuber]MCQ4207572.1 hypothetical protein [Streptomyces longispororuber]
MLDHLETLNSHLAGHPAPGLDPHDPLPEVALQAAEGFNPNLSRLIASYRRTRDSDTSP